MKLFNRFSVFIPNPPDNWPAMRSPRVPGLPLRESDWQTRAQRGVLLRSMRCRLDLCCQRIHWIWSLGSDACSPLPLGWLRQWGWVNSAQMDSYKFHNRCCDFTESPWRVSTKQSEDTDNQGKRGTGRLLKIHCVCPWPWGLPINHGRGWDNLDGKEERLLSASQYHKQDKHSQALVHVQQGTCKDWVECYMECVGTPHPLPRYKSIFKYFRNDKKKIAISR